jgi:hypothetical protein
MGCKYQSELPICMRIGKTFDVRCLGVSCPHLDEQCNVGSGNPIDINDEVRNRAILQRWPEVEKYLRRKIISLQKMQNELESTGRELELAELRKLLGDKQ